MPPTNKSVPHAQVGYIKFIRKKSFSASEPLCQLPSRKYDAQTVLPTQYKSDELFSSLAKCDGAKTTVLVGCLHDTVIDQRIALGIVYQGRVP